MKMYFIVNAMLLRYIIFYITLHYYHKTFHLFPIWTSGPFEKMIIVTHCAIMMSICLDRLHCNNPVWLTCPISICSTINFTAKSITVACWEENILIFFSFVGKTKSTLFLRWWCVNVTQEVPCIVSVKVNHLATKTFQRTNSVKFKVLRAQARILISDTFEALEELCF